MMDDDAWFPPNNLTRDLFFRFPPSCETLLDCEGGFLAGISLGGLKLDGTDGQFLSVDSEFLHPDYDEPTRFNDIMLVKLSTTTDVEPITLNFNANVPREDDRVTVVSVDYRSNVCGLAQWKKKTF
jgi:Trypsin